MSRRATRAHLALAERREVDAVEQHPAAGELARRRAAAASRDSAVIVLPQPLSPTSTTISPGST